MLADVCQHIYRVYSRYAGGSHGKWEDKAQQLYLDYEDIFMTACENHREMVKHFLKKGDDD